MLRWVVLSSLISVSAAAPLAVEWDQPSVAELRRMCVPEGAMPAIKACAWLELLREEARMRRYLSVARKRAREGDISSRKYDDPTRQEAWLRESQLAWEAYVDARCYGVLDATSGGTIGGLFGTECRRVMTQARTHDIWEDHLTYSDTSPPVLPEPTEPAGAEYDLEMEPTS